MPRVRDHNTARGSKIWGRYSGVTFESNPSGSTMVKSGVTATVVYGTTVKGATIVGDAVKNTGGSGYLMPFLTTSLLAKVGQVAMTTGVTKVDASYFGLTSIYFCIANVGVTNLMNKSGTSSSLYVTTAKAIPVTGVSRVYFRWKDGGGALIAKPVSVQYFAIGV